MVYDAIDLVLLAFREPSRLAEMRECSLPDGVGQIIHLAAGESAILQSIIERTGESEDVLKEASVFFLQQVLFAPGSDSYRTLGVSPDAEQDEIREHYRWLMKWLHPDRNQDAWEAVHADRVNVAWQDLKTPERRANYDRQTDGAHMQLAMVPAGAPLRVRPGVPRPGHGPLLSGSMVRKLPTIILGTLGVSAALIFGLMYWAQKTTERELSERRSAATTVAASPDPAVQPTTDPVLPGAPEPAEVTAPAPATVAAGAPDAIKPAEVSTPAAVVASTAIELAVSDPAAAVPIAIKPSPAPLAAPTATAVLAGEGETSGAAQPSIAITAATPPAAPSVEPAKAAPEPTAVLPQVADGATVHEQPVVSASTPVARSEQDARAPAAVTVAVTPEPAMASTAASLREPPKTISQRAVPPAAATVASADKATHVEPAPVIAATPVAGATNDITDSHGSGAALAVAPGAPSVALSEALVREFASAYASGNVNQFDQLFASGSTPADLQAMRQRMRSAEMRYLEFGSIFWDEQQGQARALAKFRDTFVPRGEKRATTETGLLELRLAWIAGEVRIADADRD